MRENLCPADELVEIDVDGFLEADPSAETEVFDLNGKEVD